LFVTVPRDTVTLVRPDEMPLVADEATVGQPPNDELRLFPPLTWVMLGMLNTSNTSPRGAFVRLNTNDPLLVVPSGIVTKQVIVTRDPIVASPSESVASSVARDMDSDGLLIVIDGCVPNTLL